MNANHQILPPIMPELPLDLIVDILCRLPAKTLLRFRCLSKQFRSIIDGPDFINRHLQFHSLDQRLMVAALGDYPELKLLLVDFDSLHNAFEIEPSFENWECEYSVGMIGFCDGLLALSNSSDNSICLWNVSTKKHQILPEWLGGSDTVHGFGRDAATDDYKLVQIAHFFVTGISELSVYSLKANCWRRIDDFFDFRYLFQGMAILVEGTLNWLGELVDYEERKKLIVSFDLKDEFFFDVSLPDTIGEIQGSALNVMVLGGCLCLVNNYLHQPVYDIWVMKEYGFKDSWTRLYSISYDNPTWNPRSPATFLEHGEKIFIFQAYGEQVFRFDLKERKFDIIKNYDFARYILTGVSVYVESLVSPDINN